MTVNPVRTKSGGTVSVVLFLFIVSLFLPISIWLGPLQLTPSRVLLLFLMPILVTNWIRGDCGKKHFTDFAFLGLSVWASFSFLVVHGLSVAIEAGGIFFVETFGAYILGRRYIRNQRDFIYMCKTLLAVAILILPFALVESFFGRNLLLELAQKISSTGGFLGKNPRWGLDRAQGTFEHPILWGVFASSLIGITYYVSGYSKPFILRVVFTGLVTIAATTSLSAGPMTAMTTQYLLIFWNAFFSWLRGHWKLLTFLFLMIWIFLDIASDRGPVKLFISYFSFNEYSAYMRVHIWNFGTNSILSNPLFGIGFNEWERPSWMSSSVDMFWIVFGIRHGIPAMLLTLAGFFAAYLSIAKARISSPVQIACRTGFLVSLTGLFFSAWTVHLWDNIYLYFMLFIGAGIWLRDAESNGYSALSVPESNAERPLATHRREVDSQNVYTRFSNHRRREENEADSVQKRRNR
ncbi:O-antigen ligase family protein [Boseongicola aestuarii]|uniref:O-Antigen ligase n=1 Tax=Boseongicola aestuarii TaxID=1470561 RepID=A0A238J0T3_9RHOB|nr:hypothetical protein [Boseongicola aestuarii]SMX24256.1 hypothetical protein BOA8489_02379 [Boseongicola aestuarii]